ncbi:MAG: TIGR01212 family radical SAM protein [Desulfovibrio aminophilus]|uniref:TIGR01212 family radical SAM protein n=1 Tax=Desulfovibrio aminophilus TaxID=81425 RepID=UPI0039EB82B3
MRRFPTLSEALRRVFGRKVWKIPLDAGFSCPNRDGSRSRRGCSFCNERGSGTGLAASGLSLRAQWDLWRDRLAKSRGADRFLAYLQSFSNTYGPPERLAAVLDELRGLPGLAGICVGTRPDCLDGGKIALLAGLGLPWIQVDLGLQSADPATLTRINRGHDPTCFARATAAAASAGLLVCGHLMAGLPGEGREAFLAGVDFLNALPVAGIKLHNTLVLKGTELAKDWEAGEYEPPSLEEYAAWVAEAVDRLRPDIVVQRLCADPAPGELLAPAWASDKAGVLAAIRGGLAARGFAVDTRETGGRHA